MPTHADTPRKLDAGEEFFEIDGRLHRKEKGLRCKVEECGDLDSRPACGHQGGAPVSRRIVPCKSYVGQVCRHVACAKAAQQGKVPPALSGEKSQA